ncbi:MAG TPA: hypothetical protein VFP19_00425 [Candidatus Limnocylindrales bacterium]|nr:hypothetical protein [Candidatus Limnocylindrales bacterium]
MTAPDAPGSSDSLITLLAQMAASMPEVRVASAGGGGTEWSRGGRRFAVLEGDAVELRLDPAIAAAALRTPDTSPSTRGTPWVRFAPAELDGHAIDRVTAWFGLAYRRATGS